MRDVLPTFSPIAQKTRREYIVEEMRAAIFDGRLRPGSKVTEARLAEQFKVSRGPLREAMRALVEEGLLVNKPYSETTVAAVDLALLESIYTVRRSIEELAFSLCWDRRTEAFRHELTTRHRNLVESVLRENLHEEVDAEIRFHSYVYEYSGNPVLLDFWNQISQKYRICFFIYKEVQKPRLIFAEDHSKYLEAALGNSLEKMKREVEIHLEKGIDFARKYFEYHNKI
jgi:DNA-binding GntR family transcriptional regulator